MKKIIVTGLACLAVSMVSSSKVFQPTKKQDIATLSAILNNYGNSPNRKDIGSAD